MQTWREIVAVSALNLRNLPQRIGSSFVIVIGIAGVVAVLISVLALATGFRQTIDGSAREDRAIVLSRGAESEAGSSLPRAAIANILDTPGVRRNNAGRPIASAETLIVAPVARKSDGSDAYITLRGVGREAGELRPELHIVAGRPFRPAVQEMIVGRAAQARFAGLNVGERILLRGGEWTVVGVFESGGTAHESGLMADAETVLAAYKMPDFRSVTLQLEGAGSFGAFKDALTADPTLAVEVKRETQHTAEASQYLKRLLDVLAWSIGSIMGFGALFGALNTMYTAVSSRSNEIATLRALGFGAGAVVVSVFVEALLLTFIGAGAGAALAYFFFNGHAVSTIGGTLGNAQLVYELKVTQGAIALGMGLAGLLALLGGLFPAIRAARLPIVAALRAS